MCGRFALLYNNGFYGRFEISNEVLDIDLKPNYNAAPGQTMPVITRKNNKNQLEMMRWGLIPVWASDAGIGYKMINAKAETVAEKPTWKRPFKSQRCLVPASGFYEWQNENGVKTPYYIHLKDSEFIAFAGLYDKWTEPITGELIYSFSIITTEANKDVASIHHRMPVILTREQENTWLDENLNKEPELLQNVLRPYIESKIELYKVSTELNSAKNNYSELINKVD